MATSDQDIADHIMALGDKIEDLQGDLGRAHDLNIALREMILRSGDSGLNGKMARLVDRLNKEAKER